MFKLSQVGWGWRPISLNASAIHGCAMAHQQFGFFAGQQKAFYLSWGSCLAAGKEKRQASGNQQDFGKFHFQIKKGA